ncbi:MAG: MFS transporter [Calditrichia bacterium]
MNKTKKQIYSWALYDWANSAYTTTIIAGFFPIFFKSYWAVGLPATESTFWLGTANSAAAIMVALLAPVMGAIADAGSYRKFLLTLFVAAGGVLVTGFWFIQKGQWEPAILCYLLATICWSAANVFYDALLPLIVSEKKLDSVSSLGYGLGYIGGGLLFLLNVLMFLKYEWFGIPDATTAVKLAFLTVGIWWVVFSIPLFLFVKEPPAAAKINLRESAQSGFRQLFQTIREIKKYKVAAWFLLAYWLYIDGVDTIIRMAVDYGKALNFADDSLIMALLLVQFVAFPASIMYGWIAGKTGVKKALLSGIVGYMLITFLGYFMQVEWHFYVLAVMVGLFQGGVQALSRSMFARLIPREKSGEFFGFYNMLGKFAAVLGPVLMGTFSLLTGSVRFGILSILLLLFSGGLLLYRLELEP